MKKILISLIGLISMASLVGCDPENNPGEETNERDVYYTVAEEPGFASLSGITAHTTTEAEWDALLDRFCTIARNGEEVTFYSSRHIQAKGTPKDTPTSITTSSRDELKAWMKEMEQAGKTVNVTYDDNNGLWNGIAYANINNQNSSGTAQSYTGTLVFVPVPVLDNPPLDGVAMALQVDNEGTYIIAVYGMIVRFDNVADYDIIQILQGKPSTFEGIGGLHTDLNGNTFLSLDIEVPESGVIEF
mgnify:CR=1 FL=1